MLRHVGAIELQCVESCVAIDRVTAIPGVLHERVVAGAKLRNVVAAAADDDIVAVATKQRVVAVAVGDRVVARAAFTLAILHLLRCRGWITCRTACGFLNSAEPHHATKIGQLVEPFDLAQQIVRLGTAEHGFRK